MRSSSSQECSMARASALEHVGSSPAKPRLRERRPAWRPRRGAAPRHSARFADRRTFAWFVGVLLVLLAASMTASAMLGSVSVDAVSTWRIVAHHVLGTGEVTWSSAEDAIVWDVRAPRVLLGVAVGASLALAGATLQSGVRNALADPYLVGVSSGAGLGVVLLLQYGDSWFGVHSLSVAAFIGAMVVLACVILLSRAAGRLSPTRFILCGVAVSYVAFALVSYSLYFANNPLADQQVLFWTLGSLAAAGWDSLLLPIAALTLGMIILCSRARQLDAVLIGDETATSLGVRVDRFRIQLIVISALVAATAVAVSGGIGFVGLMVPHVARMFVGASNSRVLPASVLLGAILLVWVDVGARTILAPQEIPVGVLTAIMGGPFFLWLLRRRGVGSGGAI
jgi:iron complex transport system permease protein